MSLFYKHAKANEPRSNSYNNGFTTNPYGSSLSALDTAWKSVVAAKQELSSVDTRLRQAVSPAADKKNNQASFPPPPKQKSKDNQNIEKRVVYKYADGSYHKENIPPKSFPVPCSKYADFRICEGNTENIVPTRRKLYKEDRDVSHQIDFNCETNKDSVKEDQYKNTSLAGRSLLKMDHSSYALNRLKERILQQKLNSSLSSIQTNETPFPQKIFHKEEDVVNENKSQGTQLEEVKRKVAAAPAAPSYKGTEGLVLKKAFSVYLLEITVFCTILMVLK